MGSALKFDDQNDNQNLESITLTKEQIEANLYPRDEIYELIDGETVYGPFWNAELKDYLTKNNLVGTDLKIKNIDEHEWQNIFNHPYFQRRKPSLVSANSINKSTENFYVLNDGKKDGPYNKEQIEAMLSTHAILPTAFVSIDNGHSWGKLYEVEGFDRRGISNTHLPSAPNGHIFTNSIYDADKALSMAQKNSSEKDAIVGLAYIGHLNEGKKKFNIEQINQTTNTENEEDEDSGSTFLKNFFTTVFVLSALVVTAYFSYTNLSDTPELLDAQVANKNDFKKTTKAKEVKTTKTTTAKVAPAKTARKPASKNKRALKVTQGRTITRSDESIKNADFLDHEMTNGEAVEVPPEAIFDDANEAVELDPIRSRISKETIDPENEGQDSFTDEEITTMKGQLGQIDDAGSINENDAAFESPENAPGDGGDAYED